MIDNEYASRYPHFDGHWEMPGRQTRCTRGSSRGLERISSSIVFVGACNNRNLPDGEAARAKMERRKWRGLTPGIDARRKCRWEERERDRTENGCLASLFPPRTTSSLAREGVEGGGRSGWNAWRKKRLIGNTYCDRRKRAMQEGGRERRGQERC